MSDIATVDSRYLPGPTGRIAVYLQGDARAPAVVMTHSILSSSMMWDVQAAQLAEAGWRVVCVDARGHGGSGVGEAYATMDDLTADTIAVMDALAIDQAHYVGLSLGGMSGFALARRYPHRLLSLVLCDCRADAPPAVAMPWNERIEIVQREDCGALAESTTERWFGKPFLDKHADITQRFRDQVSATSVPGFVACARAIQQLDELAAVEHIAVPTTLIVGANDGVLPEAMQALRQRIAGAVLEVIPNAGHLPNIDQPAAFDAALVRHFSRVAPQGAPITSLGEQA